MTINPQFPWFCAQIGAREHYAIPRALHQGRGLATLYTDFWAGPFARGILPAGGPFGSLASRFHPDLAQAPVHSFNLRSLAWETRLRLKPGEGEERYLGFCEVGQRFALAVREGLKRRRDLSPQSIFFAYDTGALEAMEFLRERGTKCVLDQMDPNRVEVDMVRGEEKLWPDWVTRATRVPEEYFFRREKEWALADRVVVNSDFSRQALVRQGVPAEKLVVVPLCYEAGDAGQETKIEGRNEEDNHPVSRRRPLQVLYLGQVILRKGIQYLVEAAKLLRDEPVHFNVVGPMGISANAARSAPSNMRFHGRVGRDQVQSWYRQADIFVLPTLSDGFALTQVEAMAHGLPVIATANCGEVVTDGVDGFVLPLRDPQALARTIARYGEDRPLLQAHQAAARRKAGQFTLARLAENLAALQTGLYS